MPAKSFTWPEFDGRICVVTGAGSGIGAQTACEMAASGAWVAALDRDGAAVAGIVEKITLAGGRAISVTADVTDEDAIRAAAVQVQQELGTCTALVNNAALVGYAGPLMDADLDLWDHMQAVNLKGALICTKAFGRQMVDAGLGGSIVNVASICGHTPLPLGGAYSVGKAGLLMLTRMLSLELAPHRIRCNAVSPGLVRTPATEAAYSNPAVALGRDQMVPAGRVADSLDLANVIAFLLSERSLYVNGQDILVDGGLIQTIMGLVPKSTKPMKAA